VAQTARAAEPVHGPQETAAPWDVGSVFYCGRFVRRRTRLILSLELTNFRALRRHRTLAGRRRIRYTFPMLS
jgi:hypothetical protein